MAGDLFDRVESIFQVLVVIILGFFTICMAFLALSLLALIVILAVIFGQWAQQNDFVPCLVINNNLSYVMGMEYVTANQGSMAEIECKVVNFGLNENHQVYWTSSQFEAGLKYGSGGYSENLTIYKPQDGLTVSGKAREESFNCWRYRPKNESGTVTISVLVQTFALRFDPVTPDHEGWYTCKTNVTIQILNVTIPITLEEPTTGLDWVVTRGFATEKKVYLSVVE